MKKLPLAVLTLILFTQPVFAEWHLQWEQQLPPRQPAWQYTDRMSRDVAYEPVSAGKIVVVGCDHNNAVIAYDLQTGVERWRFYTNGPIRVAPAIDEERVYVASDDGHLYCLNHDGQPLWKLRGGLSERKVIGHEKIISAWPASAAPVLHEGVLYYVAGYWPVDGIFVYAIDAKTGDVRWRNPSAEFRPFGEMRVAGGKLYIRGHHGSGTFELATGKMLNEKHPKFPPPARPDTPGVKGNVRGKFAANGRVFATTAEGGIFCFGEQPSEPVEPSKRGQPSKADSPAARSLLQAAGQPEGFALVAGLEDGTLVHGLLKESDLHVVAMDADADKVNRIRRSLDRDKAFDQHRLTVLVGSAKDLPPYFASLIASEREGPVDEPARDCLRPYGGVLAERVGGKLKLTRRDGPLPDTDDWRQEFCNEHNTLASRDKRVKAPLGLLWYGGPAGDARFYFDGHVDHQSGHGLNPQPVSAEVCDGRMMLQGPARMGAVDIYTGRVLWETKLPEMYTFGGSKGGLGIHSKKHPEPWRYEEALKYEVPPTHHCRASGFNYVSLPDGIYIAASKKLMRLDPTNGKVLSEWPVPLAEAKEKSLCWGGLRASGDYLIATVFNPQDLADAQAGHDGNGGDYAGDRMPMRYLVVLDRHSGKMLWNRKAAWGFVNRSGYCMGGGKVFCVDLLTTKILQKLKAAGRELPATPPQLYALDLKTGQKVWNFPLDVFVKNIVYSPKRDLLVVPCRNLIEWQKDGWKNLSIDKRRGRTNKNAPGLMRGFRGQDGKIAWQVEEAPYHSPHIVLDDLIIDRYGYTYDLQTGKRNVRTSPLTGQAEPWNFRKGGCNHLIACDNLVTWRCAFYDLSSGSGVMKLTGMDAGCTPTLLPAGGVLNIPNFGTHHKRNRMTAMALVHRPQNELWTDYAETKVDEAAPLVRAGFNFGAPGDRLAEDGMLWVRVTPRDRHGVSFEPKNEVGWFEQHATAADSFVAASGMVGVQTLQVPAWYPLDKRVKNPEPRKFQVRLHFAEPNAAKPGERVFTVYLQDKPVLKDFDVTQAAGGSSTPVVRTFKSVEIKDALEIRLEAKSGQPILCGVELIAE